MFEASGLQTDFYELTMMNGYVASGMADRRACFDLFIRSNPFQGGYALAAGLADAVRFLKEVRFAPEDLDYLKSFGFFSAEFLDRLRDFRFRGSLLAVPEGTPIFPRAPILRLEGTLLETQLVETLLLNLVNFQTLVATKAARVAGEARDGSVLEFGMRRAQGANGAFAAARAAYIGGAAATSNAYASARLDIPAKGTHAHAWVMSFSREIDAFRAYAKTFPDNCLLLVDTYDTLNSGIPNAILVGKELRAQGKELAGIRLDSGDLAYLSRQARKMLDDAGFPKAKIVASGDLDEYLIRDIREQGGRIDVYGVGTRLVTAEGDPHLTGVYKLAAIQEEGVWQPRMKLSENIIKETLPGIKQVWRVFNAEGVMEGDVIALDEEGDPRRPDGRLLGINPLAEHQRKLHHPAELQPLLEPIMKDGEVIAPQPSLEAIRARAQKQLARIDETTRRLANPHIYKVSISERLLELRNKLRSEKRPEE
jgi:nicotinate phosphoribosyltransferase